MKDAQMVLFGDMIKLESRMVMKSDIVVPGRDGRKGDDSILEEFVAVELGPDVKNVRVGDVVIVGPPNREQGPPLLKHSVYGKQDVFLTWDSRVVAVMRERG